MKLFCLLAAVALHTLLASVRGSSVTSEVLPGKQEDLPVAFDIVSKMVPSGDVQFTVRVSNNIDGRSRFAEFPPAGYGTFLGTVRVNVVFPDGGVGEVAKRIRTLACERKNNVIQCVFIVSRIELEIPNVAFSFVDSGDMHVDTFFFRPQKFLKP